MEPVTVDSSLSRYFDATDQHYVASIDIDVVTSASVPVNVSLGTGTSSPTEGVSTVSIGVVPSSLSYFNLNV